MWKRGKKSRNIHISGVYPLLLPREERKIPGEEENQQDKICKEVTQQIKEMRTLPIKEIIKKLN